MQTVYAIVLVFGSWDACWQHVADHIEGVAERQAEIKCRRGERERPPLAPETSIRPKGRNDD